MHGQGELTLTNGENYKGGFVEGIPHGEGEFTTCDNNIIKGVWESGLFVWM